MSTLPPAFSRSISGLQSWELSITFSVSPKSSHHLRQLCIYPGLKRVPQLFSSMPSDVGSDSAVWTAQHRIPQGTSQDTGRGCSAPSSRLRADCHMCC